MFFTGYIKYIMSQQILFAWNSIKVAYEGIYLFITVLHVNTYWLYITHCKLTH